MTWLFIVLDAFLIKHILTYKNYFLVNFLLRGIFLTHLKITCVSKPADTPLCRRNFGYFFILKYAKAQDGLNMIFYDFRHTEGS